MLGAGRYNTSSNDYTGEEGDDALRDNLLPPRHSEVATFSSLSQLSQLSRLEVPGSRSVTLTSTVRDVSSLPMLVGPAPHELPLGPYLESPFA